MLIVALSRRRDRTCAIVEVDGELDAFNCRLLVDTLAQAVDGWSGAVIVDLSSAGYFAAAGAHCLEHAGGVLRGRGRVLHLVCPVDRPASPVLRAAGLHRRWTVHADVEQAVHCAATPARSVGRG